MMAEVVGGRGDWAVLRPQRRRLAHVPLGDLGATSRGEMTRGGIAEVAAHCRVRRRRDARRRRRLWRFRVTRHRKAARTARGALFAVALVTAADFSVDHGHAVHL